MFDSNTNIHLAEITDADLRSAASPAFAQAPMPATVLLAHLALANLYAQQLHQPAKARPHYEKVLDLDPNLPQAAAISQWLDANGG